MTGGRVTAERDPGSIDDAVERMVAESALRGERIVSWARLVIVALTLARQHVVFGGMRTHELERSLFGYPAQALLLGFSIAVLCGLGKKRTRLVLHLSVFSDLVGGFLLLLPNSLWPGTHYQGAPFLMDTATLFAIAVAAGLRHYPSVAALGGALAGLALAGLAIADHAAAGIDGFTLAVGYTMFAVILALMVAISLTIAIRSQRLIERAAHTAVAANKAERGLRSVLHGHHDLRTVITSAQLNADLFARRLARGAALDPAAVDQLREDLGELRTQLDEIKAHALEELASLEAPAPVELDKIVRGVVSALAPRFPHAELDPALDAHRVLVAGGAATLRRIVANLIVNACEGDGATAARHVEIRAHPAAAGRIALEISDDGPGLAAPSDRALSTKLDGTGVGIQLVEGLVRACGGTVAWTARDGGGTHVVVELVAA